MKLFSNYIVGWRFWLVKDVRLSYVKSANIGTRSFETSSETGSFLLSPVSRLTDYWEPNQPMKAICQKSYPPITALHPSQITAPVIGHNHQIPGKDCSCGIYAFLNESQIIPYFFMPSGLNLTFDQRVVGPVALWGNMLKHKHGYRAEYAYPLSLHFLDESWYNKHGDVLRDKFGVPTSYLYSNTDLDGYCWYWNDGHVSHDVKDVIKAITQETEKWRSTLRATSMAKKAVSESPKSNEHWLDLATRRKHVSQY